MSSRVKVLSLYKALLRASAQFPSYNYRTYAMRRTRDAFRNCKGETNSDKIDELLQHAEQNLQIIRRQASLGKLYESNKLIIESLGKLPCAPERTAAKEL